VILRLSRIRLHPLLAELLLVRPLGLLCLRLRGDLCVMAFLDGHVLLGFFVECILVQLRLPLRFDIRSWAT